MFLKSVFLFLLFYFVLLTYKIKDCISIVLSELTLGKITIWTPLLLNVGLEFNLCLGPGLELRTGLILC